MQRALLDAAVPPTCLWMKIAGDRHRRRENAREAGAGGEYEFFVHAHRRCVFGENPWAPSPGISAFVSLLRSNQRQRRQRTMESSGLMRMSSLLPQRPQENLQGRTH